jgi:hypothetical protein
MDRALLRSMDHRRQGPLRRPARLEEGREVRALAELGDLEPDPSRPGVPGSLAIAIALVAAARAALAMTGAAQPLDLGRHQPFGGVAEKLADQIAIGPLLDQLEKGHPVGGHRRLRVGSSLANPTLHRRPAVTASAVLRLRQSCVEALRRRTAEAASYTTPWDA